ncbi:MAG: dienelactone hydrolase family protein [Bacteroidota bacterium]
MKRLLFLLCLGITLSNLSAQADSAYQKMSFQSEASEEKLLYRFLQPNTTAGKLYPLVLFLHGAGERGDDNTAQLVHVTHRFSDPDLQAAHPTFVIAPQCPKESYWPSGTFDKAWGKFTPSDTLNAEMRLIMALLEEAQQKYPIDPNRIYVAGLSMGGFGTWDFLRRFPNYFAAGVPVCGGGYPADAERLVNIPIWALHGSEDNVVPASMSRDMLNAIKEAGGSPNYTEFPGVGHGSWNPAFPAYASSPFIYDWLFSQHR